jgi:hypothetical protein
MNHILVIPLKFGVDLKCIERKSFFYQITNYPGPSKILILADFLIFRIDTRIRPKLNEDHENQGFFT